MRNITKTVLALAVLVLVIFVSESSGILGPGLNPTPSTVAQVNSQNLPAGHMNNLSPISGCNNDAALVSGFDPITGVACYQASP